MAAKKLDFNFAPIDVNILDHEKMLQACEPTEEHPAGDIRPWGLWSWCAVYVTRNRTKGRVTRAVVRSAPGGITNDKVVAKLVESGLFIVIDEVTFEMHNHAKKLPHSSADPRSSGAIREARRRDRKKAAAANDHASHEASQPVTDGVTQSVTRDVTGASRLSPLISTISDLSESRSEDPASQRARGRWEGNASMAADATVVYAMAVGEAVGRVFAFPPARYHTTDLLKLMGTHGPTDASEARRWLAERVTAWVRAEPDDGEWHPSKFCDWLNRDGKPKKSRAKVDTRQPLTGPEPEWLKRAKTGTDGTEPF